MAGLRHNLEYFGARFVIFWAQLLSPRSADRFGAMLGTLVYHLLSSRRKVAFDNIKSTIGQDFTDIETNQLVKKVFQNIGRTIIEIARFEKLGIEGAKKILVGARPETFKKAHDGGKGCIGITAHFGNWEMLGSYIVILGYPMHVFAATLHNLKVNEIITRFRKALGLEVIPIEINLKSVFKVLKNNGFVAMAVDQHAPAGIKIDFLGKPAMAPRGPALFAIRAGCPICPYLLKRENFDRHVMIAGDLIFPPQSGDEEADIRTMTETYLKFFEEGIRKFPDQWMWTHRRWKL